MPKVKIDNLTSRISDDDLRMFFKKFGDIKEIKFSKYSPRKRKSTEPKTRFAIIE